MLGGERQKGKKNGGEVADSASFDGKGTLVLEDCSEGTNFERDRRERGGGKKKSSGSQGRRRPITKFTHTHEVKDDE